MQLYKKLIFLIATLLLPLLSNALDLREVQARLKQHPLIRSEFTQKRTISGVAKPLLSSGNFLLSQSQGILWLQTKPFPMTIFINAQKIVQDIPGSPPNAITAETNPQLFQFNSLMHGLLQANSQVLEQSFTITTRPVAAPSWSYVLTPKDAVVAKIFKTITIQGNQFLEKIILTDQQSDTTEVVFSNHTVTPNTLTDNERSLFHY